MSVITENNKDHLLNYEGVEQLLVKINDRFARTDRYATPDTLGMIKAEINTEVNSEDIFTGDNHPVQITTDGNAFVNINVPTADDCGSVSLQPSWSNGVLTLTAVFGTTTTTTSSTTTTSTTTTTTPSRSTVYVIEGTFSPVVFSPLMWTEDYNGNALLLEDEELVVTYYKSDGTVITGNEMFSPGAAKYKITTTYNPSATSTDLTASKYLLVTGKATALTGAPSIGGKISILPSTNTTLWSTVDDGVNDIVKSATLNFGSTVLTTVAGTTPSIPSRPTVPPGGDTNTIRYHYEVSFNTIGSTIPSSAIVMAKLYSSRDLEIATTPVALGTDNTSGTANWNVRTTTSPGSTLKVKLYTVDGIDGTLESNVQIINFTLNSSSDTEYFYSASNITFTIYASAPYPLTNPDDGSEPNNDDTSSLDDVINEYMNEQ